jgi:hypothetical protein
LFEHVEMISGRCVQVFISLATETIELYDYSLMSVL